MKRRVNECGEIAGPLWLCVSLISSWWEAVWGRDGAYYSYGTLRTPCEALLGCLLCGQQYSRYKHSKQHMKGNHYPKKKKNNTTYSAQGSLVLYDDIKQNEWKIVNFSCAAHVFSSSLISFLLAHPNVYFSTSTLELESSFHSALCSSLYVLLQLSLYVVSFPADCVRNLVEGRHEERFSAEESQWELREMNELTLLTLEKPRGTEQ